jgi:SsrA-binding protein
MAEKNTSKGQSGQGGRLATHRKALRDYFVLERVEAGIALQGTEVKSARESRISLDESHGQITDGELWLLNCQIQPYSHGNVHNHDPARPKRLLLHKVEIRRLQSKVAEKGLTLVPLAVYLKGHRIKVEIGLCRGKQLHDKRETLKQKDADREARRAMASRGRD